MKLSGIKTESEIRTATGFEELDRVLGGGIVAGSLVLVGGDPGIGKINHSLQVCKNLTRKRQKVLYISGEESLQQIKLRASRIGSFGEEMLLLCETSLETIRGDRACAAGNCSDRFDPDDVSGRRFLRTGKCIAGKRSYFCIYADRKTYGNLHFYCRTCDKEGVVAGPRVLEHMVDTVLYFEGDRHAAYRILRGVKNRFGSTNEIGVLKCARAD